MYQFIIAQCLLAMGVSCPTQKFVQEVLTTWLTVRGRFNFANLSRYSSWHERTFRRGFARGFSWGEFNQRLLTIIIPVQHEVIAALDASFVKKSGKHTAGLGMYFNGCAGRVEKGLELSLLSLIDVTAQTGYALWAWQTIASAQSRKSSGKSGKSGKDKQPAKVQANAKKTEADSRLDECLRQVQKVRPLLPLKVRYLAVGCPLGGVITVAASLWMGSAPCTCRWWANSVRMPVWCIPIEARKSRVADGECMARECSGRT
jgi:hypothetical protein